jgi:type VI secretion system secreted protein VgrG
VNGSANTGQGQTQGAPPDSGTGPQFSLISTEMLDGSASVRLRFPWDRPGPSSADNSVWARVSTLWAGKQWGGIHIPRIGQEVGVDFLEGNPDQPVVVGSVYNADQMPPWMVHAFQIDENGSPRPQDRVSFFFHSWDDLNGTANASQGGIGLPASQTGTNRGRNSGGFNEIVFEDRKGSELLYVRGQKDQAIAVEHDESHWVGQDRTETVGANTGGVIQVQPHQRDDLLNKIFNQVTTRSNVFSVWVTVGFFEVNEQITLGSSLTETGGTGRTRTVTPKESMRVGKLLTVAAGDEIILKTGDTSTVMKKNGDITISGKDLDLKGSGNALNIKGSALTAASAQGAPALQ